MKRKRFVDLSLPIETGLPSDPPMMIPKIDTEKGVKVVGPGFLFLYNLLFSPFLSFYQAMEQAF